MHTPPSNSSSSPRPAVPGVGRGVPVHKPSTDRGMGADPGLVHRVTVPLPTLPAELEGLRVLHLSDLHVRRSAQGPRWESRVQSWAEALASEAVDLVAFTGDYAEAPGDEPAAAAVLARLTKAVAAGTPALGVFGNHDTSLTRQLARGEGGAASPGGVTWLDNEAVTVAVRGGAGRLRVVGLSYPEDPLAAALGGEGDEGDALFTLVLAHYPSLVVPAADLGWPLVLAGHTHGGQVRISPTVVPHTACDLPTHLASGCLRLGETLCCISRGLGDGGIPGLRINCPAQAPLYTLVRGPLPGEAEPATGEGGGTLHQVMAW